MSDQNDPAPSVVPDEPILTPPGEAPKPSDVPHDPADEPDATAAEAKTEDKADGEEDSEDEGDEPRRRPRSGYARLKARSEAERNAYQNRIRQLESELATKHEQEPEPIKRPRPEDFSDYPAYEDALDRYHDERAARAARQVAAENRKAETEARQQEDRQAQMSDFFDRWEDLQEKMPDAAEAADNLFREIGKFNPFVRDILAEVENGETILYYLAKNPGVAKQINSASPLDAAMQIGELKAKTALPRPNKQTKAPPPMNTPKGGASPPTDLMKLAKSDDVSDYIKARQQSGT